MKPQLSQVNIICITVPHYNRGGPLLQEEAIFTSFTPDTTYAALDRAAFLIERACVPRAYPTFCAETAQLLAMLEAARQKSEAMGAPDSPA